MGFGADEDIELAIAEGFELVVIFTEFVFVDLDGVALESAEELAMKGNRFVAQLLVDELLDFVSPRYDDWDLLILDQLEFLSSGAVVEEEGQFFFPGIYEVRENVFAVPTRALLVVVFVEVGLDGLSGKRVGAMEVENFMADIGSLGEVTFGGDVLRVKDVG